MGSGRSVARARISWLGSVEGSTVVIARFHLVELQRTQMCGFQTRSRDINGWRIRPEDIEIQRISGPKGLSSRQAQQQDTRSIGIVSQHSTTHSILPE